jgi:hypothetical protein
MHRIWCLKHRINPMLRLQSPWDFIQMQWELLADAFRTPRKARLIVWLARYLVSPALMWDHHITKILLALIYGRSLTAIGNDGMHTWVEFARSFSYVVVWILCNLHMTCIWPPFGRVYAHIGVPVVDLYSGTIFVVRSHKTSSPGSQSQTSRYLKSGRITYTASMISHLRTSTVR